MEWHPDVEDDEAERPRDPMVDQAKEALRLFFRENQINVFYQQQLAVFFENVYFHWITVRALYELTEEGRLIREELPMPSGTYPLRVYRVPTHRNWRRQGHRLIERVSEYSSNDFARAVGRQGEAMFDAGLPRFGFMPKARDVREWQGRRWERTEHNLDRVFEADGRAYGVEIKNTLKYIPKSELLVKIEMCHLLGLIPLFIMRFAPKVYNFDIIGAGGFSLLFKDQLYPFGNEALAERVRGELRLPVHCPATVPDGVVQRFASWHQKQLQARSVRPVENVDSRGDQREPPVKR
jgi:hypothetical protein